MTTRDEAAALAALDAKVNALLPPRYQHCYAAVSPTSMGSAGLKYGADGKVAWDRVWTTFCDLALAGGPPHRGTLLEPVPAADAEADPTRYRDVVAELGRAIGLTTGLSVVRGDVPGWVGVTCGSRTEAAWLRLAVLAENVSARRTTETLYLPAGPAFRVEKEVKNVVVALAKAYHYWDGHLTAAQQGAAGDATWEPAGPADAATPAYVTAAVETATALWNASARPVVPDRYVGWVGVECPDEEAAVWLLRAVVVDQVPARREGATLYLPVSLARGVTGRVAAAFASAWRLWGIYHAANGGRP